MNTTDHQVIEAEVNSAVNTAGAIASVIMPQYAAFIVLGQAIAKAMPELYDDVIRLLNKQEPTDEDTAELAKKIAALSAPETI